MARVVNESLVYLDTKVDDALATVSTLRVGLWTGIGNGLLFMCVAFIVIHCCCNGRPGQRPQQAGYRGMPLVSVHTSTFRMAT